MFGAKVSVAVVHEYLVIATWMDKYPTERPQAMPRSLLNAGERRLG